MQSVLRCVVGLVLVAVACMATFLSCQWGTELDTPAVVLLPGVYPSTGLYAAPWIPGNGFWAICAGVVLPTVLLTLALWIFVRIRHT